MSDIKISSAGPYGKIVVDDQDISNVVTGVDVRMRPGQHPAVTVTMRSQTYFDGKADVQVDARLHVALVALGWTPPTDDAP